MNLIVSAYNHEAEQGNVVVIGADRPDGAIFQDKGRPEHGADEAWGFGAGGRARPVAFTARCRSPAVTTGPRCTTRSSFRTCSEATFWSPLPSSARASHRCPTTFSSELGSFSGPAGRRPRGPPGRASQPERAVHRATASTAHGASAYRTPCISRKVGMIEVAARRSGGRGSHERCSWL